VIVSIGSISLIGLIGLIEIGTSLAQHPNACGVQIQAALCAVQLLHFVQHSSTASQCSKKKSPVEICISGIEDRTK